MPTIDEIRKATAELLEIELDEVDWITEESLAKLADAMEFDDAVDIDDGNSFTIGEADLGDLATLAAPAPNRISYGNTFTNIPGHPHIYWQPNCQLWGTPFFISRSSFRQALRNGTCSNGHGGYILRFKIWWYHG